MLDSCRVNDCVQFIAVILACVWLKDSWRFSDGIKELHAKHMSMFTCLNAYLFVSNKNVYRHNDTHAFVLSFGRSGTMMTVNLLHQLRTYGDDTFDDIMRVGHHIVPITGLGSDYLNNAQLGEPPRIYWSHGFHWQIPEITRGVYIIRNPIHALRSWHGFVTQFYQLSQPIAIDDFYFNCIDRNCFWPNEPAFNHIASWWRQKQLNKNIIWLHFENFNSDPSRARFTIQNVGNFFGFNVTRRLEDRALKRISYRYFMDHQRKFDIHDMQIATGWVVNQCMARPDFLFDYKKIGVESVMKKREGVQVTEEIKQILERKWRRIVTPATGFDNYEAMMLDGDSHIR